MSTGGQYNLSVRDHQGKIGTTSVLTGAVTAISLPGLLTQYGNLRTAIGALSIGVLANENAHVFDTILSQVVPTADFAQRGMKWLVQYHDNTEFFDAPLNAIPNGGYLKPFSIEIPCANLALLNDETDELDIAVVPASNFVTAFQAIGRSPYGGTVVVDNIKKASRNVN